MYYVFKNDILPADTVIYIACDLLFKTRLCHTPHASFKNLSVLILWNKCLSFFCRKYRAKQTKKSLNGVDSWSVLRFWHSTAHNKKLSITLRGFLKFSMMEISMSLQNSCLAISYVRKCLIFFVQTTGRMTIAVRGIVRVYCRYIYTFTWTFTSIGPRYRSCSLCFWNLNKMIMREPVSLTKKVRLL